MAKIPQDTATRTSEKFCIRFRSLISDYECSNTQFAKMVGISKDVINRATIYMIIPCLKSLIKIADFLNISITYLLAEDDNDKFYKSEVAIGFTERLEQLRIEKGVTYYNIAKFMPFSKNFFYEWKKNGTLPSLEYLFAISDYFEVSPDYLLGRTDEKN